MEKNNDLVDISSAAKLLGVSKLTLRNWDNSGILKAIRIGKRGDRRYKKEDLENFLGKKKEDIKKVNLEEFKKYVKDNEFWLEEAPGLPFTLEAGFQEMTEMADYFKPGSEICACKFVAVATIPKWP